MKNKSNDSKRDEDISSDWVELIEKEFHRLGSSDSPDDTFGVLNKLQKQGLAFLKVSDSFNNKVTQNNDWFEVLKNTFEHKQRDEGNTKSPNQTDDRKHQTDKFEGLTQSLSVFWETILGSMDNLQTHSTHNSDSPFYSMLTQVLDVDSIKPDINISQHFSEALSDYQSKLKTVHQYFKNFDALALAKMKLKIDEILKQGQTIDSAKELYGIWLSSCEEVYESLVHEEKYFEIYGELINAQVELKKWINESVTSACEKFGLPHQGTINEMSRRMQQSRREIQKLQNELSELKKIVKTLVQEKEND